MHGVEKSDALLRLVLPFRPLRNHGPRYPGRRVDLRTSTAPMNRCGRIIVTRGPHFGDPTHHFSIHSDSDETAPDPISPEEARIQATSPDRGHRYPDRRTCTAFER